MIVFVLECKYKPKYVFVYMRYVIFDSYVQSVPCEVKLCNDEIPPKTMGFYTLDGPGRRDR